MNEEKYIREKMGTRNPFTVPEGYFDQLARQVIGRLPEEGAGGMACQAASEPGTVGAAASLGLAGTETPRPAGRHGHNAIVRYLRPLLYAAACAVLAVAVGMAVRNRADVATGHFVAHHHEAGVQARPGGASYSDTYMEEMADYAMLDNEDIYASLLADL